MRRRRARGVSLGPQAHASAEWGSSLHRVGWADAAQTCAAIAAVTILFATFAGMIVPGLVAYGVALAIVVQVLLLGVNLSGIR